MRAIDKSKPELVKCSFCGHEATQYPVFDNGKYDGEVSFEWHVCPNAGKMMHPLFWRGAQTVPSLGSRAFFVPNSR